MCKKVKKYLPETHPWLIEEWDKDKNEISPGEVTYGSNKRVWWLHGKDKPCGGHSWITMVKNRTGVNKTGCPACSGKAATVRNNLAVKLPELFKDWDKDKNGDLRPEDVTCGSDKKVWWVHGEDKPCGGYSWQATVYGRAKKANPTGCPACSNRAVTARNNLLVRFSNVAKDWDIDKNGELLPEHVVYGSHKKVWWAHGEDKPCGGHSWKTSINKRTRDTRPTGCPACANQVVTSGNNLEERFPEIAKEVDEDKTGFGPKDVTYGSDKVIWWKCDKGHSWESSVCNRTSKSRRGCPFCPKGAGISKASQNWLDGLNVRPREYRIKRLGFKVDGFDPETNTVYEFLGDYWHGNPERFKSDKINEHNKKTFGELYEETVSRLRLLEKAGYKVIYVWEKDFKEGKMESSDLK